MKKPYLLSLIAVLLLLGCHKNPAPPAPTADAGAAPAPDAQPAQPAAAPSTPAGTTENVANEPIVGDVSPFLTEQLRIFVQQKGRMPTSFSEFIHTRLDSIPAVPAGKKWVIDTTTSQVKAVAK
jgi:hypothetical protein